MKAVKITYRVIDEPGESELWKYVRSPRRLDAEVSKNTKHFFIAMGMPPMQMDIIDPLNIGKEELTS